MTAFTAVDDEQQITAAAPGGSAASEHRPAAPVLPAAGPDAAGMTDEQPVDLADQILRLVRAWSFLKAKMVSSVDPEVSSLFLVGRLVKDGPTRAKDLAEATCADQSTVSRQVAGLVKAGLIERQADPDDGRASILVPTPHGVEKVNKHFANRGRALEPLLADWSSEERHQFLHLLRRFTTNLEARRDDVAKLMTQSHEHAAGLPAPRPEQPTEQFAIEQFENGHSANSHSEHIHSEHVRPHERIERSN